MTRSIIPEGARGGAKGPGQGGKRNNGSRRARAARRGNRARWASAGIKVGSINI